MATVPLSGSDIRLLSSVPFSNDYKNTRWFETVTEQTNYFIGKPAVHTMGNVTPTYFKNKDGKSYVAVNKSIDDLWSTNYMMFRNTSYNSKWFYAFVTHLEYVNNSVTHVYFEIDVFQTWKFDMTFKPSYVVREHCKLWNSDGTPVINTVDEGLNYGTEMDNVYSINHIPNNGYKWLVILAKQPMHQNQAKVVTPVVVGSPQPLSIYLVPFKDDDTVAYMNIVKENATVLTSKPTDVLKGLYTDTDAVNNIVSLYITDYIGIPFTFEPPEVGAPDVITFPDNGNLVKSAQISDGSTGFFNCLYVKKIIDFSPNVEIFTNKYYGYKSVSESKLLMYPYTQLILDDFKGNRIVLKNEYITSNDIEITLKGSLGVSNKTSYSITNYNYDGSGNQLAIADETALINNEPNDIPIITDLLSAYIQGNKNSIRSQMNSIEFNGYANVASSGFGAMASGLTGNAVGVANGIQGMVTGAGNTVLQLQAIQAKNKDIANTPPSIAKMGSNTSYTLGNNYNGLFIIKKQIKDEYIRKLEDFFNMFGYKLNEVKVPNFHTRQYWNYVQTKNCIIQANINNEDLQELKNIFDNGITLWHTDDIGNYSLSNGVIA
jgi:hypothetical protein